ncbi:hypothetical protein EYV94_11100 [Puteibacter caeruleilacunae]|nr:hypothetical protein EYV94_11100 [Puteibacter caeruleilacunae]
MKKLIISSFIILVISNIAIGLCYLKEHKEKVIGETRSTLNTNKLKARIEAMQGSFMESYRYSNRHLNMPDSQDLSDYTLCLYISEHHCSSCVKSTLEFCKENYSDLSKCNFFINANFNNSSIKYFRIEYQLKCNFISTYDERFSIAEEKYPCFFVYNKKEHETDMFFFPLKHEDDLNKKFLKNVLKKYEELF